MFGDKFNLGGLAGLGGLMKNAKKMQEMFEETQAELAKTEVVGEAGAGIVKVRMTAKYVVKDVQIDDELLKESKEIIQDLVTAAVNNALQKVDEVTKSKMSGIGQLFGGLGGLGSKE